MESLGQRDAKISQNLIDTRVLATLAVVFVFGSHTFGCHAADAARHKKPAAGFCEK